MRTRPILQLMLFSVLLVGSSEEFFFEYPRKALTEFFQSLRAKKQPPKTNNIQHYHVHYYPIPIPLLAWTKAPDKRALDKLYEDTIESFGWSKYYYKYSPDPSIIVSSDLQQLWDDTDLWDQEFIESDTIDLDNKGILVQVPVNQRFAFHLLKKLQRETT